MTVSIIIAVKTWQRNLDECIDKCRQLAHSDFEIIVLPDALPSGGLPCVALGADVRIIPTGALSPSAKRDQGVFYARGDIVAFIDDDAYPQPSWLNEALKEFSDAEVAAVAGPAVTPPEDSLRQKASGAIYCSRLVSAGYAYRYIPRARRRVDDYPSCNLLVRKTVFDGIGGFDTELWPGEDTKLCLAITKKLRKKIIYNPAAWVYHHRRCVFVPHLVQISNYALHRGYFVKRYPETSCRIAYFMPSVFVIGMLALAGIAIMLPLFRLWLVLACVIYSGTVLVASLASFNHSNFRFRTFFEKISFTAMVFAGIIGTHFTYGIFFIRGLLANRLREES